MKKIKAYTLSELIVVLLISVLVVGIAFSTLQLINKQMASLKAVIDKKNEVHQMEEWLSINFYRSDKIWLEENKIHFQNSTDVENPITHFEIAEQSLVMHKDTLDLKSVTFQCFQNGQTINKGIIDAVKLHIPMGEEASLTKFVYKVNTTNDLMNAHKN